MAVSSDGHVRAPRVTSLTASPIRWVGVVTLIVATLAMAVGPASAAPDAITEARSALARATEQRRDAEAEVAELERRRIAVADEATRLGALDSALTEELAASRRALREFAVEAYIDGGQSDLLRASLSVEQAQALAWQASLSGGAAMDAEQALLRFDELKDAADPDRVRVAAELDSLDAELEAARFDAIQASAFERDAEAALARAEQAAADAAAEQAASERAASQRAASERAAAERAAARPDPTDAPRSSAPAPRPTPAPAPTAPPATAAPAPAPTPAPAPPPPAANGAPTAAESATLAKIRRCESGGNYSIVSASGRYRGAYQFDVSTWRSIGGSGDPAAASPAEQDYRALLLLRLRGTRPWPHCGR